MTPLVKRVLVVIWTVLRVAAAVLLAGWVTLHLLVLDRRFGVRPPVWPKPAGAGLLLAGGVAVLFCGGLLSTSRVIPTRFVVFGPFRYVRNPMSLGAVAMLLGLGLFCRSISILLFSAVVFFLLHIFVVFVEEPGLERRFQAAYVQYKESVNRWLPSLPR